MEVFFIRKEQNDTWEDFEERINSLTANLMCNEFIDIEIKELHDDVVAIIKIK